MSEMLKKARAYEAEKAAQTDKNTRPLFHISHLPDGSMIRTVFPFTMEKSICSTSIIHMQGSGDRCTGGTV